MSKTKEITVTLSDHSEFVKNGWGCSISKYVTVDEKEFWIHKYDHLIVSRCSHPEHKGTIYTVNAKIDDVFYTVRLDPEKNPICQYAEKQAEKKLLSGGQYWDVSEEVQFQSDPQIFVDAVEAAHMFGFDHPEILQILGEHSAQ